MNEQKIISEELKVKKVKYEVDKTYPKINKTVWNNKKKTGEKAQELKFTDEWVDGWCKEYGISLKHPNKRFSIAQDICKDIIIQFLKNVWRTRYWWLTKQKMDPPILSADQIPLHRNEQSTEKTLNI